MISWQLLLKLIPEWMWYLPGGFLAGTAFCLLPLVFHRLRASYYRWCADLEVLLCPDLRPDPEKLLMVPDASRERIYQALFGDTVPQSQNKLGTESRTHYYRFLCAVLDAREGLRDYWKLSKSFMGIAGLCLLIPTARAIYLVIAYRF